MTEDKQIEGFGLEAQLPYQVNYQQLNKTTLSSAIYAAIEHYRPWGSGKIEQLILKPRYVNQ